MKGHTLVMDSLPEEIVTGILGNFTFRELLQLERVSRQWRRLIVGEVWKVAVRLNFALENSHPAAKLSLELGDRKGRMERFELQDATRWLPIVSVRSYYALSTPATAIQYVL